MKIAWLLALSVLLEIPAGADTPHRYRLTVLPLTFVSPNLVDNLVCHGGINQAGQVAGMTMVHLGAANSLRAAVWQKNHRMELLDKTAPFADPDPSNLSFVYPTAINSQGEAAVSSYHTFSGAYTVAGGEAYYWRRGRMSQMHGFPLRDDSAAFGLNNKGWLVGGFSHNHYGPLAGDTSAPDTYIARAFLWRDGQLLPLWQGIACGINNKGEIVGSGAGGGLLWRNGRITPLKMQPVAINERTEIAGNIPVSTALHASDAGKAYLWRRGRLLNLSKQISHASALNNRGQVVGEIGDDGQLAPTRAVLWRQGRTYDLNRYVSLPNGWILTNAIGINDHGWIIGEGSVYKTPKDTQVVKSFTFLLTPRSRADAVFFCGHEQRRQRRSLKSAASRTR